MRSKAPLTLMEQAVMVLVFALAAALCLRVFVWSDRASRQNEARDRAAVEVQSVAEIVKNEGKGGGDAAAVLRAAAERLSCGGQAEAPIELHFNADWTVCGDGEYAYGLRARAAETDVPGLGAAVVWAFDAKTAETIFEITVAWQMEVGA